MSTYQLPKEEARPGIDFYEAHSELGSTNAEVINCSIFCNDTGSFSPDYELPDGVTAYEILPTEVSLVTDVGNVSFYRREARLDIGATPSEIGAVLVGMDKEFMKKLYTSQLPKGGKVVCLRMTSPSLVVHDAVLMFGYQVAVLYLVSNT